MLGGWNKKGLEMCGGKTKRTLSVALVLVMIISRFAVIITIISEQAKTTSGEIVVK